jgi:hypothetical protein
LGALATVTGHNGVYGFSGFDGEIRLMILGTWNVVTKNKDEMKGVRRRKTKKPKKYASNWTRNVDSKMVYK